MFTINSNAKFLINFLNINKYRGKHYSYSHFHWQVRLMSTAQFNLRFAVSHKKEKKRK